MTEKKANNANEILQLHLWGPIHLQLLTTTIDCVSIIAAGHLSATMR